MNKFIKIGGALSVLLVFLFAAVAQAQEDAGSSRIQSHQKKSEQQQQQNSNYLMTPETYKKIQHIQKLFTDKKYAEAIQELNDLLPKLKRKYERAVALQTYAWVYLDQNKYQEAARYLKKTIDLNALPPPVQSNTTLTLGKIYVSLEKYQQALELLIPWSKTQKKVAPSAYATIATAYAQQNKYRDAIPYIAKAVKTAKEPHDAWYRLWLASLFETKQYRASARLLTDMVSLWPDNATYWRQLAQVYLQLNEDISALNVYAVAYHRNLLKNGSDYVTLAQLDILHNNPYEGGVVLQQGISKGIVEKTQAHYELLASAWNEARETDKALDALGKAAALADTGSIYLRQAQLYNDKQDWGNAVASARKALRKGGLDKPGQAYMLQGMASVQLKKYNQALAAFKAASRFKDTRKSAVAWIHYVNTTLLAER